MMTNLFSVFDPCTGMLSMNWLSTFIYILMIPYSYWVIPNKMTMLFNKILYTLSKELLMLMPYKGTSMFMVSMFMFILINNSMGLFPYVFTSSSHLMFSLSLALPIWLSLMSFGWLNNMNSMFTHLVPVGTPVPLMPFMVMIETISNLIRPWSLAVRLTANMIAGHLLMSLLGNNSMMIIYMLVFIMLMMFEMAVSIIQSYVFMTLMNLYSSEV